MHGSPSDPDSHPDSHPNSEAYRPVYGERYSAMYGATRRSLHALAELVLAGPRYRQTGRLRLRVGPAGFGTWDDPVVAVIGGDLVTKSDLFAVDGLTYEQVAARAGLVASALDDVYGDGPHVAVSETVHLDPDAALQLQDALILGNRALALFRGDAERVLWPEHFDVATTVEAITYGVSPGDAYCEVPYAYVSPQRAVTGPFWNAPFGAARPLRDLGDLRAVAAFFRDGARLATPTTSYPLTNNIPGGDR
jgi:hypothetical protein